MEKPTYDGPAELDCVLMSLLANNPTVLAEIGTDLEYAGHTRLARHVTALLAWGGYLDSVRGRSG